MRRSTLIAALTIPASLTVAAALSAYLPSQRLAHALEKRLCTDRGMICTVESAHFSIVPWPAITAQGVSVALNERPGLARAASLSAELELLPLLSGDVVISGLSIEGATIRVDAKALQGASGTAIALLDGLAAQDKRWTSLPGQRVRVTQSRLVDLQDREWAHDADLRIDLPGETGALAVNGSARWRGETVRVTARLATPRALLTGGRSDILAGFTTPLLTTSIEGTATGGPLTQINGTFTAASPNPAALAVWLDEGEWIVPPFAISTAGQARIARGMTALTMNRFTIGKTELEGNVAFRRDAQGVQITGTLAADRLDIPARTTAARAVMHEGEREFLPLVQKQFISADLRLSATQVIVGDLTFSNVGVALIARDRKVDVVLAGADFAGGRAKGRLGLTSGTGRIDARLQAHLETLDLGKALAPFGIKRMNGTLSGQAQLDARGLSMRDLMRTLEGRATFNVKQGDLVGVNVPEILRRIEKRPLLTALDIRGGRTPFETASATIRFANGIAEVTEASIVSPATQIDVTGSLQLPDRTLALKGIAAPNRAEGAALPFEIKGSFDEPALIPDARALIRRSGAAAPFFAPVKPTKLD
jgi:AsmA protein